MRGLPAWSFTVLTRCCRVHLAIREKLSLALNRDGGLDSLELKGDLDLRIASPDVSKIVLQLSHSDNFTTNDLQFKTHPRIDKKAWTDSKKIQLRDTKQAFPVRTGLAVLKWRLTSKDESIVPLSSKYALISRLSCAFLIATLQLIAGPRHPIMAPWMSSSSMS